jgi:hypothetical protein
MIPVLFSKADIVMAAVPLRRYPDNRCLRGGSTSAALTCRSKTAKIAISCFRKEMRGRLEEIGLSFPPLDDLEPDHDQHANRHCCYGAAGLSSAQPALGQSDYSATSSYNGRLHADWRQPVEQKQDQTWRFQREELRWLAS